MERPPHVWVHVVEGHVLMSIVLPAIEFVWWQDSVLPWVKSMRWKDKPFVVSSHANAAKPTSFPYCFIIFTWSIELGIKMVIVRGRLVKQHQVLSYYDTVPYNNSRLLQSTVMKKKEKKADPAPGSEVLTPINRLPVTRSWNWSTWANSDLPHYWPPINSSSDGLIISNAAERMD